MGKIKEHYRSHKITYHVVGTSAVVAVITSVIVRSRYANLQSGLDGRDIVTVRPLTFFSSKVNVVTVIEREGRGHPGYIVRCVETGEVFTSQTEAAKVFNVSPSNLSSHLNGKFEDCGGNHFERLGLIA